MAVSSMRKHVYPAEQDPWEPLNNLVRQMPCQESLRPQMLCAGQTLLEVEADGVGVVTSKDIRCLALLNESLRLIAPRLCSVFVCAHVSMHVPPPFRLS